MYYPPVLSRLILDQVLAICVVGKQGSLALALGAKPSQKQGARKQKQSANKLSFGFLRPGVVRHCEIVVEMDYANR
jgi:hypothetical protein